MKLFKYYSDSVNSFKSISVKGLWCHFPNKMNDPAECLHILDREFTDEEINLFKKYVAKSNDIDIKRIASFENTQIVDFFNLQRKKFIEKFTFVSLSESFDDILMWSHYASSHSGFVVEFDFDETFMKKHHFQKIHYTDNLPKLEITKIAEFMYGKDDDFDYFFEDVSKKLKVWENEKEWRVWRNKPCYFHYEGTDIKNVYFGINTTIETKALVAKLVAESNKDVIFNFMEFSKNPVKLTFRS